MIDISKLDKADVLAALYNSARPLGMGHLHYTPENMTHEEAILLLDSGKYFDYLKGRVMKVDLSGSDLETFSYDRDNGDGAAGQALSSLFDALTNAS